MSAADEVEKLAALHESGKISDEEFARLKASVLSASAPAKRNRWLTIGLAAAVLASIALIAVIVIAMSSDGESESQSTVVPTTLARPEATSTPAAQSTSSTQGPVEKQREYMENRDKAAYAAYVARTVASFTDFWAEKHGPLWAKNGASPSDVAECSSKAVYDYYDLESAESSATEPEVVAYLVLVCGGFTDAEARQALETVIFG